MSIQQDYNFYCILGNIAALLNPAAATNTISKDYAGEIIRCYYSYA